MQNHDDTDFDMPNDDHDDLRPSKSQVKREMHALGDLGEQLVELPASTLAKLPLDDALLRAIRECQAITKHGGRKRQLKYIGKLMRDVDADAIRNALEQLRAPHREEVAHFHRLEQWRDRLLAEGDPALAALLDEYPEHALDRQLLRQTLRNARDQKLSEAKQKQASRELFRTLRELIAQP